MSICYTCKLEKPTSDFNRHDKYKSGYSNHCRLCTKINGAIASAKRRDKLMLEIREYPCCACGFKHQYSLEIHHLATEYKRYGKSQDVLYNLEDLKMGTAIPLCANCHVIFHGSHGGKNAKFPLYTKEETIMIINNERGTH